MDRPARRDIHLFGRLVMSPTREEIAMKRISVLLATLIVSSFTHGVVAEEHSAANDSPRQKLLDGNQRYVAAKLSHPDQTHARLEELAQGQHPFAVILSCSDSRVPPEIVFDQGLGDLFVIRVAGNIVDNDALGSIEYAVEHLGVKYIMVLGHERCGAVDATVKGGHAPGHIASLVKAIAPAVNQVKHEPGDLLDNAVRANVAMVVKKLQSTPPILKEEYEKKELVIEGARYDLDDGSVTMVPPRTEAVSSAHKKESK
jgi:carbonic anhydrase